MTLATSSHDTSSLSSCVSNALGGADLHPTFLSPTAILCIRQLKGRLRVSQFPYGVNIGTQAIASATRKELATLAQHAQRPAFAFVPQSADSVLFADRAEMLACLASDWIAGDMGSCWWWKGLFSGMDLSGAVASAWIQAPEHLPAALEHLASFGSAATFVRKLRVDQCEELLEKILVTHGLPQFAIANQSSKPIASHDNPSAESAIPLDDSPPWELLAPEAKSTDLHTIRRSLVGLALVIQRAPLVLRSVEFSRNYLRWRQRMELSNDPNIEVGHSPVERFSPLREFWDTGRASSLAHLAPTASESAQVAPKTPLQSVTLNKSSETVLKSDTVVLASTLTSASAADLVDTSIPSIEKLALDRRVPRSAVPRYSHDHEFTYTELGGLFYLINLGLFLGLYSDFTSPARPGLALSIWDFVYLLGRRILPNAMETDPAWSLLERLAGRDALTPPASGFEPPCEWRMDLEWLFPLPSADAWFWNANADRIWVWHPAGFQVINVPRDLVEESEQLEKEIDVYAGSSPIILQRFVQHAPNTNQSALDRWLGWLESYIRVRLETALRVSYAADLGAFLFVHQARIELTGSHLDIQLSLNDLPIAIRLAGLDRNPGWVPAASRFIAFHFE